jgi:hypothetical protein
MVTFKKVSGMQEGGWLKPSTMRMESALVSGFSPKKTSNFTGTFGEAEF